MVEHRNRRQRHRSRARWIGKYLALDLCSFPRRWNCFRNTGLNWVMWLKCLWNNKVYLYLPIATVVGTHVEKQKEREEEFKDHLFLSFSALCLAYLLTQVCTYTEKNLLLGFSLVIHSQNDLNLNLGKRKEFEGCHLFYKSFLFYIGVKPVENVVIVSCRQHSVIHIYVSILPKFPSHPGCHIELWAEFLVLCSRCVLVIHFKYSSVVHIHPKLPNHPFLPSSPLATISLFSKSVSLFLFHK